MRGTAACGGAVGQLADWLSTRYCTRSKRQRGQNDGPTGFRLSSPWRHVYRGVAAVFRMVFFGAKFSRVRLWCGCKAHCHNAGRRAPGLPKIGGTSGYLEPLFPEKIPRQFGPNLGEA